MTTERTRRRDDDLRQVAALAAAEVIKVATETAATLAQTTMIETKHQTQLMQQDLEHIKTDVAQINSKLDTKFVTVEAFDPVKRLVYGLTALVLTSVVAAVLTLVIKGS